MHSIGFQYDPAEHLLGKRPIIQCLARPIVVVVVSKLGIGFL
jgi:hypothetical protein